MEHAYAVVSRRGSEEAGAIFVVLDHLDGRQTLFAGAPQSLAADAIGFDRVFTAVDGVTDAVAVRERLERERKFDPDIWVVEVEDRQGRHFLDLVG
jgi:hypothetical protein